MDHRRFDNLTRSVAAPNTRRGLLGSLAALGAGLLTGRNADAQQVTQAYCGNQTCKNNPAKCATGCVCCAWSNSNNRCVPPGQCTAGGVVVGGTTTAAPTTTTTTTTTAAPICGGASEGACPDGCTCAIRPFGGGYVCVTGPILGDCEGQTSNCPPGQVCLPGFRCKATCPVPA